MQRDLAVCHVIVRDRIEFDALARHSTVARAGQRGPAVVLPDVHMGIVFLRQENRLVRMHVLVHADLSPLRVVVQVHVHHVVVSVGGGGCITFGEQVLHDIQHTLGGLQADMRINCQLRRRLVGGDAGPVAGNAVQPKFLEVNILGFVARHRIGSDKDPAVLVHGVAALVRRVVVQFNPQIHRRLRDGLIRNKAKHRAVVIEVIRRILGLVPVEHFRGCDRDAQELVVIGIGLDQLAFRVAIHILEPVPPVRGVHDIVPVQVVLRIVRPCRGIPRVVIHAVNAVVQRRCMLSAVDVFPAHHIGQRAAGKDVAVTHGQHLILHIHILPVAQAVQGHFIGVILPVADAVALVR